ncbi:MAG: hypothetical protein ACOCYO_03940 [Bacteroidota bacterium]
MGKYLNSKYNDRAELYLIAHDKSPEELEGHYYMTWNNRMLSQFRKEKNISVDARLTEQQQDEYTAWLESKVISNT